MGNASHIIVCKGQDFDTILITLNATTGVEIDPSLSPDRKANAFIIQARTAVDIQISREAGMSQYWTIKSGTVLELDLKSAKEQPFFLRAASGSPVAEVIYLF